ncbi:hypothetical protein THICB3310109 [Thiomonas sp. CB3]|nr:hypothetical protein THICB3310109 [Thiomonas sp. CB3]
MRRGPTAAGTADQGRGRALRSVGHGSRCPAASKTGVASYGKTPGPLLPYGDERFAETGLGAGGSAGLTWRYWLGDLLHKDFAVVDAMRPTHRGCFGATESSHSDPTKFAVSVFVGE